MIFLAVMKIIIGIGGALSTWLFRKGGIYNPIEPLEPLPEPQKAPATPSLPPAAPVQPKKPSVSDFALAIRDFEGSPGDANYLNHNPGNCRYLNVEYLPIYEPVKCSPKGFAIFKDYATGWLYLINMLKAMIHSHPNRTILDFMSVYAPTSDNNPTAAYADFIAKRLGVTHDFRMGDLVDSGLHLA